jgi:hypothetical protein
MIKLVLKLIQLKKEIQMNNYFPKIKYFHSNPNCLLNWNYHDTIGKKYFIFPPFMKKISISPILLKGNYKSIFEESINNIKQSGIQVISQSSFDIFDKIKGKKNYFLFVLLLLYCLYLYFFVFFL